MIQTLMKAVILFAAIALFSTTLFAQEYEIRLSRPDRAGEKYRLLAKGTYAEGVTVSAAGRVVQQKNSEFSVELVSLLTVISTSDTGRVTKFSLAIERFLLTSSGTSKALVASDQVIFASREGNRYVFTLNDAPLDALSYQALSVVIPTQTAGVTDDDVFGTREKKKVGDRWPINATVAATALESDFKITTESRNIKGFVALDGAVRNSENDYLIVSGEIEIDEFSVPVPDGMKMEKGQFRGSFYGQFPIDEVRQPLVRSIKMAARFSGTRPPDEKTPPISIEGLMMRSVTQEMQGAK